MRSPGRIRSLNLDWFAIFTFTLSFAQEVSWDDYFPSNPRPTSMPYVWGGSVHQVVYHWHKFAPQNKIGHVSQYCSMLYPRTWNLKKKTSEIRFFCLAILDLTFLAHLQQREQVGQKLSGCQRQVSSDPIYRLSRRDLGI